MTRVMVTWFEGEAPIEYELRERDGELWATLVTPGPPEVGGGGVSWVARLSEAISYMPTDSGGDP